MNKMKKILGLVLACALLLGLTTTSVFAYTAQNVGTTVPGGTNSIKIEKAVEGDVYYLYKIFDAAQDATTSQFNYTTTKPLTSITYTPAGSSTSVTVDPTKWFTTDGTPSAGNPVRVSLTEGGEVLTTGVMQGEEFRAWVKAYGTPVYFNNPAGTGTTDAIAADENGLEFTNLSGGYYAIRSERYEPVDPANPTGPKEWKERDLIIVDTAAKGGETVVDGKDEPSWDEDKDGNGKVGFELINSEDPADTEKWYELTDGTWTNVDPATLDPSTQAAELAKYVARTDPATGAKTYDAYKKVLIRAAKLDEPIPFESGVNTQNYVYPMRDHDNDPATPEQRVKETVYEYIIYDELQNRGMSYLPSPVVSIEGVGVLPEYDAADPTKAHGYKIHYYELVEDPATGAEVRNYLDDEITNGTFDPTQIADMRRVHGFAVEVPWTDNHLSTGEPLYTNGAVIHIGYKVVLDSEKKDLVSYTTSNDNEADFDYRANGEPDWTPEEDEIIHDFPEKRVKIYTTDLKILKTDQNGNILTGAEFTLEGDVRYPIYTSGTRYVQDDVNGTFYKIIKDINGNPLPNPSYTTRDPRTLNTNAINYQALLAQYEDPTGTTKYVEEHFDEVQWNTSGINIRAFVGGMDDSYYKAWGGTLPPTGQDATDYVWYKLADGTYTQTAPTAATATNYAAPEPYTYVKTVDTVPVSIYKNVKSFEAWKGAAAPTGQDATDYVWYKLANGTYTKTAPTAATAADYAAPEAGTYTATVDGVSVSLYKNIGYGYAIFRGIGEGEYTLTETVAPEGYKGINPITFTVKFDKVTKTFSATITSGTGEIILSTTQDSQGNQVFTGITTIVNDDTSEFPETGGIGTYLFYIIGAVLAVGAIVVIIVRKRIRNREQAIR